MTKTWRWSEWHFATPMQLDNRLGSERVLDVGDIRHPYQQARVE
jgi:hypothetical protein